MLTELSVENFALIERARLSFGPGLNLLTGETGAGKSILLDALGAVLGERVGADLVRHGAERARIEGVFSLDDGADVRVRAALDAVGIAPEDHLLILTREIALTGKGGARINGRTVTVATLKAVGDALVDIHGQHAHQSLLAVEHHAELLDAWAGSKVLALRSEVAVAAAKATTAERELSDLRRDARERARTLDLLRFQDAEIAAAALQPGEDDLLAAERLRVGGAEKLHAAAAAAYSALRDQAAEGLSAAVAELERAVALDPALAPLLESLQSALYLAEDAARDVRHYRDGVEFNPERLAEIESRLDLLKTLKRKYGETIDDVLRYHAEISERRALLENADERLAALEQAAQVAQAALTERAARLTAARQKAAKPFATAILKELGELAMGATRFAVGIEPRPPGPTGADSIEFLIAPNPGEPLRPLAKIASGGEISRVMLALKSILARASAVPTVIFDEIDTGIGGRTGTVLGQKLHALGRSAQILCVTHLAPIAARGDTHIRIEKRVEGARTAVAVCNLAGDDRVAEIARMLGGKATAAVLTHARELLAEGR
jgi:DNA repair protein RecN (Recombination protein N)